MNALLVLCRHGNTFESGDRVYIVGAHEDLPLTGEGEEQAQKLGQALANIKFTNLHVICAPLQRTLRYAEILASNAVPQRSVELDSRLTELDYGEWSGMTHAEIEVKFGSEEIKNWDKFGVWPDSTAFNPPREQVRNEVREFLDESKRSEGITIAVTSNGRLRTFAELVGIDSSSSGAGKMKTGRCAILVTEADHWRILGWDLTPDESSKLIHSISEDFFSA